MIESTTRFLALTSIPLILVITIRMLLSLSVLGPSVVGLAAVLGLTAGLTYFRLFSTPARLILAEGAVAVDDAWTLLSSRRSARRRWFRVIDVSETPDAIDVTVGLESFSFVRKDWPEFDDLCDSLRAVSASHRDSLL